MAIHYNNVVPWGRSYDEYVRMFALSGKDLSGRIIGCGDGPASFNSVLAAKGVKVISADPLYRFSADEIEELIKSSFEEVIRQTYRNRGRFIWRDIPSIKELGELRLAAMRKFLEDFEKGKKERRYVEAELPGLPFENGEFDLALCSHLLFLYTDNLTLDFHVLSVREMCRVAGEVRIFPLLDVNGIQSPYVDRVMEIFNNESTAASVERVDYEFQKHGNRMLVIRRKK
ncbi:MAG: SAM-dependent methyltransferase [Brevinematales bacterium]|jgi:hypothetical protein